MTRGQAGEVPGPGRGAGRARARRSELAGRGRGGQRRAERDCDDTPPNRGLRLLVVEDSEAVVERIVETLAAELGLEYVESVDSEADALAARGPWDAAIVDLSLREGNGFSLLRALQRRAEPRPFVVVLTDYAREEFRALAATFGAREFLHKATDFERLAEVLRPVAAARLDRGTRH